MPRLSSLPYTLGCTALLLVGVVMEFPQKLLKADIHQHLRLLPDSEKSTLGAIKPWQLISNSSSPLSLQKNN